MRIYNEDVAKYAMRLWEVQHMIDEYVINVEGIDIPLDVDKNESNIGQEKRLSAYQFIKIRELTGMNRKDFAEWLGIPYRTISDWEHGERKMPDYVLRLIAYKVRMEFLEKRGD